MKAKKVGFRSGTCIGKDYLVREAGVIVRLDEIYYLRVMCSVTREGARFPRCVVQVGRYLTSSNKEVCFISWKVRLPRTSALRYSPAMSIESERWKCTVGFSGKVLAIRGRYGYPKFFHIKAKAT